MIFKIMDILSMKSNRRYFCKEEIKKKKCSRLRKSCCIYKHICKL